ncbi:SDR family oxidoreductase [Paraburkholderia dipogonis]|uniref:SDR family oxidoreductase n=1 Tax=Paraburkholderia dipogonis TaxID=1211383 RepID=A0A4Y8MX42_9BURK|nr:SDR family oxidoreductase [Paraburkholderia dipogonis]TFE41979.1 SDR family oxidoreductase [Paraburkholderia dipogonis]
MKKGCVVVTGASRGIGAAIAEALARSGFTVACLSRTGGFPQRDGLDDDIRSRLIPVKCDINNRAQLEEAFQTVVKQSAVSIVGLVNNAGIHLDGASDSFALADFESVMSTNVTALFSVSQVGLPYLREAGSSVVVNIGSFFDKLGVKRNTAYCASKAAVGAITRCLAVEWAKFGVRVMNVAPGYIVTDLNREEMSGEALRKFLEKRIPMGKPGGADDVAHLVVSLFGDAGAFMTGETFYVDGGQGMAL